MTEKKYENVEVDFDDETFIKLAKMAHGKDITLNQLCNDILRGYIIDQTLTEEQSTSLRATLGTELPKKPSVCCGSTNKGTRE